MASSETNTGQAEATSPGVGGSQQPIFFSGNIQDPKDQKTFPFFSPQALKDLCDDMLLFPDISQYGVVPKETMTSNTRPTSYELDKWFRLQNKTEYPLEAMLVLHQLSGWDSVMQNYKASSTRSTRPTS